MQLVVAGVNEEGRSYVISRAELDGPIVSMWNGDVHGVAEHIERVAVDGVSVDIEPPAGGVRWIQRTFPTEARAAAEGYTPMGMHTTRTIDFDVVVSGDMNCILDEETVELHAGDCIVLQAASHAWENPGSEPTVMICMLHKPVAVVPD